MALAKGRYEIGMAQDAGHVREAQRLRWLCFVGARRGESDPESLDADDYDQRCRHVLIRETASGRLVACFRMLTLSGGAEIGESYSARYYNLSRLREFDGIGRNTRVGLNFTEKGFGIRPARTCLCGAI